jgi:hypothetical protein
LDWVVHRIADEQAGRARPLSAVTGDLLWALAKGPGDAIDVPIRAARTTLYDNIATVTRQTASQCAA